MLSNDFSNSDSCRTLRAVTIATDVHLAPGFITALFVIDLNLTKLF